MKKLMIEKILKKIHFYHNPERPSLIEQDFQMKFRALNKLNSNEILELYMIIFGGKNVK